MVIIESYDDPEQIFVPLHLRLCFYDLSLLDQHVAWQTHFCNFVNDEVLWCLLLYWHGLSQIWAWIRNTMVPFQYPKRRLIVRSSEVSKPRDWCLELSDRSDI